MNIMHMGLESQAISCRVSSDLRKKEAADEAFSRRYTNIARRYGPEDIISEVVNRHPDTVIEILTDALLGKFPQQRLHDIASSALHEAILNEIES